MTKILSILVALGLASEPLSTEERADLQNLNDGYRYTTQKYGCHGDCDYISVLNAMKMGEEELWPTITEPTAPGGVMRAPCGSAIDCGEESSMFAPNVRCTLTINDCDTDKLLEVLHLDCRGDFSCHREGKPSRDCCTVTGSTHEEQDPSKPRA